MSESKKKLEKAGLTMKSVKYVKQMTISVEKRSSVNTFHDEGNNNGNGHINMKKLSDKAQSRVTSQASQKMTAKRLNDSLKIEKQSTSSKLVTTMVYFSVLAIICSLVIHLLYTTSSLDEMQSSISLNRIVNSRLSKTILSWQAMLIIYARSTKLRPIDFRIPQYQGVAINSSMSVLDNAKQLAEEADRFQKPELIQSLYAKTVRFYEPSDNSLFDGRPMDQFSASNILISYYLQIARYNGSYLNLANSREFLFAMNNTGNDYLRTLDRSIADLAAFFAQTKDTNVRLLAGITTIEILFV
ncbi:MAG: hypothetical protein EOP48_28810, partial [Sphingobacteriales bacterium]